MDKIVKTTKKKISYFQSVGRRKSAVCRLRLYLGTKTLKQLKRELKKGEFLVNWKDANDYFTGPMNKQAYLEPFVLTDSVDRFLVTATVKGGGLVGQLEALRLAIARALQKVNPEFRPILKAKGLLTVDARVRERRKVGMGGKARRRRQSPKR